LKKKKKVFIISFEQDIKDKNAYQSLDI